MRLKIAYSKIKKRNLVLINNDTYQRETLSERPIRPPLKPSFWAFVTLYKPMYHLFWNSFVWKQKLLYSLQCKRYRYINYNEVLLNGLSPKKIKLANCNSKTTARNQRSLDDFSVIQVSKTRVFKTYSTLKCLYFFFRLFDINQYLSLDKKTFKRYQLIYQVFACLLMGTKSINITILSYLRSIICYKPQLVWNIPLCHYFYTK